MKVRKKAKQKEKKNVGGFSFRLGQVVEESVDHLQEGLKTLKKHTPKPVKENSRILLILGFTFVVTVPMAFLGCQILIQPNQTSNTTAISTTSTESPGYFRGVWDRDPWALFAAKDPSSPVGPKSFRNIVGDPENHLGPDFQVSNALFSRVLFWVDIYSRYDSRMKVVHDRHDMNIVYGYIDFRSLHREISNPVLREIKIKKIEKEILATLEVKIKEAVGISQNQIMSNEERAGLKDFLRKSGITDRASALKAIASMRTQTGQRDHFVMAIHRSRNFLPKIINHFSEKKLPTILARIPFVESSFNPRAESKIGAVGMWQFTVDTAQEMISLHDDSEWQDPLLQTHAAARLLKNYRSVLPDWSITITAYNSGVGNLRKAVNKYKAKKIEDLLDTPEDNGLGFAGENFYAEVVAATLVEAYKEQIFSQWLTHQQMTKLFHEGGTPFFDEICKSDKDA